MKLYPEGPGRALRLSQRVGVAVIARVLENGHPGDLGGDLFEQLQLLPHDLPANAGQPSDVAAGPRQACDETHDHRVGSDGEDDRDRAGRLLGCRRSGRAPGNDDVHLQANEFGGERRQPLRPALCEPVLDRDVLAFHIAQLAQSLPEGLEEIRVVGGRAGREETDPGNLRRRLSLDGEGDDEEDDKERDD